MSKVPHIWFAGTPEFAATSLKALIQSPHYQVSGVLTQPDRPAGRGRKIQFSAVKQVALANDIPVAQPEHLRTPSVLFEQEPPDVIIVAAYGLLLPEWFLNLPRYGCINIHASLLPRWRGAAPIQRAIEAGDTETGISIMQMDKGLDTGDVWLEKRIAIRHHETAGELHDRLQQLGATALLEALPDIFAQSITPKPQDNEYATYAHKLTKAEAQIDWTQPIEAILRRIHAFNPFPVAHTTLNGKTIRIYQAEILDEVAHARAGTVVDHNQFGMDVACCNGTLRITQMQLPGKPVTNAADLRHGQSFIAQLCH